MANFTEISSKYEKDSVVQKSASEILFDLLDIQPNDDVLDLGCGTGHISKTIKDKTRGRVVGIDPSKGIIEKAKENYSDQDITFRCCSAEQLDYKSEFEIIFCNSAFQWFTDTSKALKACYDALKDNGKMAIKAPATNNYCPNFLQAIEKVKKHKLTMDTFARFTPPWLFLDTADEYSKLFKDAGFMVEKLLIDKVITTHSAEEAYNIFESGAAVGYLNQDYYSIPLSEEYIESFRDIVRRSFEEQASEPGYVTLVFLSYLSACY